MNKFSLFCKLGFHDPVSGMDSIYTVPIPDTNFNLQKLTLLKELESEVSKSSISESTLESLELLEEIEFRQGTPTVSEAMKRAYCLVAVECTVQQLGNGDSWEDSGSVDYFKSVRKLWRGRIGGMEKDLGKGCLWSEDLWSWKGVIESSVLDDYDRVCENVVKKIKLVDVIEAIATYLREEKEKMGSLYFELVAEKAKCDKAIRELCFSRVSPSREGCGKDIEVRTEKIQPRKKRRQAAKITDSDEMLLGPSYRNSPLSCSAEDEKVPEALESKVLETQAAVRNPLSDELRPAEATIDPIVLNLIDCERVVHSIPRNSRNVTQPCLMERNNSAHTLEWGSQEDSPNIGIRPRLCSRTERLVSPIKEDEIKDVKPRRKRRFWKNEEEDALRAGVKECGEGNWKQILEVYGDKFDKRTEVDLKDKWRNMTR